LKQQKSRIQGRLWWISAEIGYSHRCIWRNMGTFSQLIRVGHVAVRWFCYLAFPQLHWNILNLGRLCAVSEGIGWTNQDARCRSVHWGSPGRKTSDPFPFWEKSLHGDMDVGDWNTYLGQNGSVSSDALDLKMGKP
jgi:hypothetical protein